ncbi:sulfite exporter TauE/SafE family protein [Microvirga makkahensis]|uniref:Probable membrane transporter protein n=1 Tax=Microvirga makkahensis TaxID=1128670 RepID=A0A7X3SP44_9HYPH|nr:sulfite exporter TauE/SafE family protein [Microvirga makkahensis]MXQ11734.1 TSUP family transporter [Microvirga makkahensis]
MSLGSAAIWIAAMVGAGAVGGILAGLLGVGGGIVIVPLLYHLLGLMDVASDISMHIAVGTSLAIIVPTAFISARSHAKRGSVDGALLRSWGPAIFIGVLLGTVLAGGFDSEVLVAIFATVALLVAANMLFRREGAKVADGFPGRGTKMGLGIFVGGFSALMGIGGGTLSVPILSAFGFPVRIAVGTSAAIGMIIAVPGALGYFLWGLNVSGKPPLTVGFVNLIAVAAIIPMTTLLAPVGVRIAHAIPQRALRYCFALFLGLTSIRMFFDVFVK